MDVSMTDEQFALVVTRYRDKDGQPTCAVDFNAGRVCIFYATQRFGCDETCVFANKEWRYWQTLNRRYGGAGSLIPLACCPLWKDKGVSGVTIYKADTTQHQSEVLRLRAALLKIADWGSNWGPFPENNEDWRAMAIVTAREAVPELIANANNPGA